MATPLSSSSVVNKEGRGGGGSETKKEGASSRLGLQTKFVDFSSGKMGGDLGPVASVLNAFYQLNLFGLSQKVAKQGIQCLVKNPGD